MAKILTAWELGVGLGHLLSIRSLARLLLTRGHSVHLVVRDLDRARSIFLEMNVNVELAPFYTEARLSPHRQAHTFADLLLTVGAEDIDGTYDRCLRWRQIVDRIRPDYLLFDHSPTAILATRGYPLPTGVIGTGFYCPVNQSRLPNWRPWSSSADFDFEVSERLATTHLNQVLSRLDAPTIERVGGLYADVTRQFLQTYPELDHFPDREGGRYYGITPLEPGIATAWPRGVGKRIFAYLKPVPVTQRIIRHLSLLGVPSIVCCPGLASGYIARAQQRFPALRLENKPVDLRTIVDTCDIAIHHGSHDTTATFLLAGKPSLVFPTQLEQRLTALRLKEMVVACMPDPRDDAEVVDGLHSVLTSASMAENARQFASRYADWSADEMLAKITMEMEVDLPTN